MATLKETAENMYGTMLKHGTTYECNTILLNVNASKAPEKDVLEVIKDYEKNDEQFIKDSEVDVVSLLSQAEGLCGGVNKAYILETYETTDICVLLFSRSVTQKELRSKRVLENLCGFMFLDTKTTKRERSIYVNLICTSRGFGSKLLRFAEEISVNLGFNRVTLSSLDGPLGFYIKKGYSFRVKRLPTFYEMGAQEDDLIPLVSSLNRFEESTDLTIQPLRGMLYNEKRSNGQHFWIYTQPRGDSPYDRKNWKYIKPGNLLLFKRAVGPDGNVFYNFDLGLYEKVKDHLDSHELKGFDCVDENGTRHRIKVNKNGGLITTLRNVDFNPSGGIFMFKNLAAASESSVSAIASASVSKQRSTSNQRTKLGSKSKKVKKAKRGRRMKAIKMSLKMGN